MAGRVFSYRLDDITEDMDWEKFLRMKAVFDRFQIKPLIGVVPCNRDPKLKAGAVRQDFWDYVRGLQNEGWTIAQHGYEHLYTTKASGLLGLKNASEFAGVSYEEQREKLRLGKEILQKHGIQAEVFMAPGHTYDENTLKALAENGFCYVTDGYADCVYRLHGMTFIPCKSAGIPSAGVDTVCLHVNGMQEEDFEEIERFIERNRSDIVDYKKLFELSPLEYAGTAEKQEKRNLWKRNVKHSITRNETVQEYLRQHNNSNFLWKWISRIVGLPGLAVKLLVKKA